MVEYVLVILSAIVAFALIVYTVASFYCLGMVVNRKKKQKPPTKEAHIRRAELRKQNNQRLYERNPEDLTIKSFDGLEMKAWFLPKENSKRFVICVHGYGGNGPDEFSHMMPFYHDELGFNYLLPDLTAHGRSEGKYIGFGTFDSKNVLLWVNYLVERFGEDIEIILHGMSMGAATVMIANESDPPEQVKLIIEDCGFTCAHDQIYDTAKNTLGFDCKHLVASASLLCKIFVGYKFKDSDPLGNMDKAKNPMLFIHGDGDTFVPFRFGQELYEACTVPKDCLWVPGAIHTFSYYDAKEQYEEKVKDFLSKHLSKETVTVEK